MADFYTEMRGVAQELLAPTASGGLGQGSIALARFTEVPPANPWEPSGDPVVTRVALNGAARGVSKELVGLSIAPGNQIVATDLQVIVAPWWGGAASPGGYDPADVLELDGKPVTVLRVDNIPAVGIVSAVRFIVRAG